MKLSEYNQRPTRTRIDSAGKFFLETIFVNGKRDVKVRTKQSNGTLLSEYMYGIWSNMAGDFTVTFSGHLIFMTSAEGRVTLNKLKQVHQNALDKFIEKVKKGEIL
jgi:hypothetical protein